MRVPVTAQRPCTNSVGGVRVPLSGLAVPLLVATLSIGAIGAFAYRSMRDDIRDHTQRTLGVIAEQKRQQIEGSLIRARIDAESYFSGTAQLPMLYGQWLRTARADPAAMARMQERVGEVARLRGWGGVAVLDREGHADFVLGDADIQAPAALIQETLRHPRITLVDLHRNARGQPEYGVLAPIGSPGAPPLGLAYLAWRAEQTLYPLVASWPVPTRTAETYLVRRDGEGVRYLTPLRGEPDAPLTLTRPLAETHLSAAMAARGQRGMLEYARDYRGVPVLAYATPIDGTPWLMVAKIDEIEAYAGTRATAWTTALIAGLALLLLYGAAYMRWRRDRQRHESERRELEALRAQQVAEARFRLIFEQAPVGLVLTDPRNGRIIEANARFAEIVGRSPKELAGLDWMSHTHPDDVRECLDRMASLSAGEISGLRMTQRYLRPDGSVVWGCVTVAQAQIATGEEPRYLAIVEDIGERKRFENDLSSANERMEAMLTALPDLMFRFDRAGRILEYHSAADELLYLPPSSFLGKPFAEVLPQEASQVLMAALDEAAATGHHRGAVYFLDMPQGKLWYEVSIAAMRGVRHGDQFIALVRDITARKHAEAQLAISEEKYRSLVETTSDCIWEVDAQGRYTYLSPKFEEMTGYPAPAFLGRTPFDLLSPERAQEARDWISACLAAQAPFSAMPIPIRHRDGRLLVVEVNGIPLRGPAGEFQGMRGVTRDITERKRMEEALRLSEERHRLLADNAVDLIWTMGLDGRFTYVSPSVEKLRGFTPSEVMRDPLEAALTPDSLAIAVEYMERFQANVKAGLSTEDFWAELEHRCKDGSTVWCDVTARPIFNADGGFVEIQGITRDIRERKRYEEQLKQARDLAESASAAKSEFLAHMSHEIRSPLNAVLGLAQLLEREPLAPGQLDMVARIRAAGQSLLAILNDILDLSKVEAGQLRIEPRPFDPGALLAKLDNLMGASARAKGLALRIEAPAEPLGWLRGDALRLEQVLLNLIGNAVKFTDRGKVTLCLEALQTAGTSVRLRFTVRDTGIGIAPEVLSGLFQPFVQADLGVGRRYGGTGLGLSICKRLVELMGGEIGAESRVGEGSAFWFDLPFERVEQGASQAAASLPPGPSALAPSGPRLAGAHFLVVDDSAINRDLIERALALEGASATLAADGQQAIQHLKVRPAAFDAVLMDIRMPVMDGLTATRLIRGELGLTELPVIALTAGVLAEQQAAARAAGVDDVLAKPLDLERMAGLLSDWVKPKPAAAEMARPAAQTRPPAGPGSPSDLPEIAGIDRAFAARTLCRDPVFFLRVLEEIAGELGDVPERTRRDLARGERASAARRLHVLRGDAGMLGALTLMESAGALEAAIDAGETDLDVALADLERQLATLIAASAPWRGAAEATLGSSSVDEDTAAIQAFPKSPA